MPNTYSDVPQTSHTLAADQPPMEANTLYLANTLGTSLKSGDHQISVGGTDTNTFEGRHIQICLTNLAGSEPTVTSIGDGTNSIIFSKNANLFISSNKNPTQFYQLTNLSTGNPAADFAKFGIANANGWTFLPGGLLLQYGTSAVNTQGTTTTIPFPIAFSTSVFSITIGCINTANTSPAANNVFVKSGTVVTNQFVVTNSSSGDVTSIYWMAIGF